MEKQCCTKGAGTVFVATAPAVAGNAEANTGQTGCGCCGEHSGQDADAIRKETIFLAVCTVFFFIVLAFEGWLQAAFGVFGAAAVFMVPYALCGYAVLKQTVSLWLKGDIFNEFSLMSLATLAALCLGEFGEAVGVMLFYRIGEHVQERAAGSSRRSIEKLLATKPATARLVRDGQEQSVEVEKVPVGGYVLVRAGEKVPLDGIIVSGASDVDQSPLTGESVPVAVSAGSEVLGGSINLNGVITVQSTRPYTDTHMARILQMIEHATQNKSQTERFITRFARYYTPAVAGAALLVALVPPLFFDAALSEWIYRALVLLIVSCPCALLISIPLGYFGGIGAASRYGILVKGGHVLDDLRHVDTVVFDKTGTLTRACFAVTALLPAEGVDEEALLSAAICAEFHASHPAARAAIAHTRERAKAVPELALLLDTLGTASPEVREIPGNGMSVEYAGSQFLAGTAAFLRNEGVRFTEDDLSGTTIYVAQDGHYLGVILVEDALREDSAAAVAALAHAGLKTHMLTGDREKTARKVAKVTGVGGYHSGLLPDGKVQTMRDLFGNGQTAFVGDGINDAPILTLSRVGIAMGKIGAEAAIEAADVVILNDSPLMVARLFAISRSVRSIVWQNIGLALGVKLFVMAFGILGLSGLWEAVFADVGVALLAVLNATRLVHKRYERP